MLSDAGACRKRKNMVTIFSDCYKATATVLIPVLHWLIHWLRAPKMCLLTCMHSDVED